MICILIDVVCGIGTETANRQEIDRKLTGKSSLEIIAEQVLQPCISDVVLLLLDNRRVCAARE